MVSNSYLMTIKWFAFIIFHCHALKNKFEAKSQQKHMEFGDFYGEVAFFSLENHLLLIQALWPCDYTYSTMVALLFVHLS